ncbi:prostaglandin reductase 1-like [Onthophagus taurus]|uniref:prostaglandin reductase 1-like n=1 Tax=Onthophagus taurus TaxID=166361 RepID=UPI000C1FDC09|nr:prostaglandin reductase 1-like [Onthophagus taurus]
MTSNKMKSKKFIFVRNFDGIPKEEDFKLVEEVILDLQQGEFLAKAIYLSIDPYMRAYSSRIRLGETMIGSQVAIIIESKNENFPTGSYVLGQFGWTTHFISNGTAQDVTLYPPYLIEKDEQISLSLYLGALGRTGNSAYFGFLELCKPRSGETVVISGAAGAVGSHVGQIAKMKGCYVIAIAGNQEKLNWLKSLGFDYVINYKLDNIRSELTKAAPRGIDCYFDNVGGEISSVIMQHMNRYGRIAVCGSISSYNSNATDMPKATILQPTIVFNELTVTGFIVKTWLNRWNEGIEQNAKWIKEGKLKCRETIIDGFENMPKAFINMLNGGNFGKSIVKV